MSTEMLRDEALAILGLDPVDDPDANAVDRAYHGRLSVYREGALASYALMDDTERRDRLADIEAAHKVLAAPDPAHAPSESGAPTSKPPPFDPASPGASLRRAREHLRLSLPEMAEKTRILRSHLIALEEERYDTLPPAPYVRGFALQYARALGIPEAEELAQEIVARSRE